MTYFDDLIDQCGILDQDDANNRVENWTTKKTCQALKVLRPTTTAEVSSILARCNKSNQKVVIHGGLTGLVGGANTNSDEVVISLERMNGVLEVDTINRTITVEAGTPLEIVQQAAAAHNLKFPVDLGARGSSQVGGNIATNAGGNQVLKYGMCRNQVLGLEAVLADGTVLDATSKLIKNNTGYDLKQLFIGSEGTLGIVTKAVLKLKPLLPAKCTALIAVDEFSKLPEILSRLDRNLTGGLSCFEVMWQNFFDQIQRYRQKWTPPIVPYPYYVIVESEGVNYDTTTENFYQSLESLFELNLISDAVFCESEQQAQKIWNIRDDIEAILNGFEVPLTFDISLPLDNIEKYLTKIEQELSRLPNETQLIEFGHLGDNNLHIATEGKYHSELIKSIIYSNLQQFNGSISAEHGIGLDKKSFLHISRSTAEINLMKCLKQSLDPNNILNSGKIL